MKKICPACYNSLECLDRAPKFCLHRSSSLSDVHLPAFTGNLVNYAILFSRVDSVFWSYQLRGVLR